MISMLLKPYLGTMEDVEITDNICMEESRHLDVSESDDNKFSVMSEGCNKERSYMQTGLVSWLIICKLCKFLYVDLVLFL